MTIKILQDGFFTVPLKKKMPAGKEFCDIFTAILLNFNVLFSLQFMYFHFDGINNSSYKVPISSSDQSISRTMFSALPMSVK